MEDYDLDTLNIQAATILAELVRRANNGDKPARYVLDVNMENARVWLNTE